MFGSILRRLWGRSRVASSAIGDGPDDAAVLEAIRAENDSREEVRRRAARIERNRAARQDGPGGSDGRTYGPAPSAPPRAASDARIEPDGRILASDGRQLGTLEADALVVPDEHDIASVVDVLMTKRPAPAKPAKEKAAPKKPPKSKPAPNPAPPLRLPDPAPPTGTADAAPMSDERRRALFSQSEVGRRLLAEEAREAARGPLSIEPAVRMLMSTTPGGSAFIRREESRAAG